MKCGLNVVISSGDINAQILLAGASWLMYLGKPKHRVEGKKMHNIVVSYEPEDDERRLPPRLLCDVSVSEEDASFCAHDLSGALATSKQTELLFEITTAFSDGACYLEKLTKTELEVIEAEALVIYGLY